MSFKGTVHALHSALLRSEVSSATEPAVKCRVNVARVARERFRNKIVGYVAEYLSDSTFCNMLQILGDPATLATAFNFCCRTAFEDVELPLPVRVENRRCSHGLRCRARTHLSSRRN